MHPKIERTIIFLLGGPKKKSDLSELVFKKRADYNITRLNEEILKSNEDLFEIKKYFLRDRREKFVHLNLDVIFNKMERGMAKQIERDCGRRNLRGFKNLRGFIKRDKRIRSLIFDLDYIKPMFYRNGYWVLPSLNGFINICLFYFFYCLAEMKGIKGQEENFIRNTRIMVALSIRNIFDKKISLEKIELKEERMFKNRIRKYKKKDLTKSIDVRDLDVIKNYFELISTYHIPSYKKGGKFEDISLLTQGLSARFKTSLVKAEIKKGTKKVKVWDQFNKEISEAIKKKKLDKPFIIKDRKKEPDYFDFTFNVPEIQHYVEPIKMTMDLFA